MYYFFLILLFNKTLLNYWNNIIKYFLLFLDLFNVKNPNIIVIFIRNYVKYTNFEDFLKIHKIIYNNIISIMLFDIKILKIFLFYS